MLLGLGGDLGEFQGIQSGFKGWLGGGRWEYLHLISEKKNNIEIPSIHVLIY